MSVMVAVGLCVVGDGLVGVVGFAVARTERHMALMYAMMMVPVVDPQAPLEQSRIPLLKSALLQRQAQSGPLQPRAEYWVNILRMQV